MYLRAQSNPIHNAAVGWSPSDAHAPTGRLRVAEVSSEWEAPEEAGPENGPDAAGEADDQAARHRAARDRAAKDRAAGRTAEFSITPDVSAETEELRSGAPEVDAAEEHVTRPAAPRVPRWAAQSTADRYRVIVRVDEAALRDGAGSLPGHEPSLRAETSYMDGTRVTPETARRLTCCSGVTRLICSDDLVKAMSTRSRRVLQRLWTALLVRDRGCRFAGCRCRINLVSHHIVHFADGGRTEYWNLILLCPVHHRGVHEGRFSVQLKRTGEALFEDRAGMPIPPVHRLPP